MLIGDPLDVKMFEATGWILEEQISDAGGVTDELVLAYMRPPLSNPPGQNQNHERADSLLSISDISDSNTSKRGGFKKEANY